MPERMAYDGSDATRSFDDDIWELNKVANDLSECHDVAREHPDKLAELQALWWTEAHKHQVLPLNNKPGLPALPLAVSHTVRFSTLRPSWPGAP